MKIKEQGGRRGRRPLIIAASLVILLVPVVSAFLSFPVLEVVAPKKGRTVLYRIISPQATLALGYRHSVELSMVWDFFRLDEKQGLILFETHFHSANAGLPSSLEEGEKIHLEKDRMRISNRRRIIPSLSFWVDEKSFNTLRINGKTFFLPELAGNTLLRLSIKQTPLAIYTLNRLRALLQ